MPWLVFVYSNLFYFFFKFFFVMFLQIPKIFNLFL